MNVAIRSIIVLPFFIATVNGIHIKCDFLVRSTIISDLNLPSIDRVEISRRNTCIAQVFIYEGKANIVDFIYEGNEPWEKRSGHSLKPKDYRIKAIDMDNQELFTLPQGIQKYFSSLKSISVNNCQLQKITKEDLRPFPELTFFSAAFNEIVQLESYLFENNPKIQIVNFASNQIFIIGDFFVKVAPTMKVLILEDNNCISENFEFHDIWTRKIIQKELSISCSYLLPLRIAENYQEDEYDVYDENFFPYSNDFGMYENTNKQNFLNEPFTNVSIHHLDFVNCDENEYLVYDVNGEIVNVLQNLGEDFVDLIEEYGQNVAQTVKEFLCDNFNACGDPSQIGPDIMKQIRDEIYNPCNIDSNICHLKAISDGTNHFKSTQTYSMRFVCVIFPKLCQDSVDIRRTYNQYDEINRCENNYKLIISKDDQELITFICKIWPDFCGLPFFENTINEHEIEFQSDKFDIFDTLYCQGHGFCSKNDNRLNQYQFDYQYDEYESDPSAFDDILCFFTPNRPGCLNRMIPNERNLQRYKDELQSDPAIFEDFWCSVFGCSDEKQSDQLGYDYESDPNIFEDINCFFNSHQPECSKRMLVNRNNLEYYREHLQADPDIFDNFFCNVFGCSNDNELENQFDYEYYNNVYDLEYESDSDIFDNFLCWVNPDKCIQDDSDITGMWITPSLKRRSINQSNEEVIENSSASNSTLDINENKKTENLVNEENKIVDQIIDSEPNEFDVIMSSIEDNDDHLHSIKARNNYVYYDDDYYYYSSEYEYTSYEYEYKVEFNDEQYQDHYDIKRSIEENNEGNSTVNENNRKNSTIIAENIGNLKSIKEDTT